MITSDQLCEVWMRAATARNNRTTEQHEETKRDLVKLLRENGAHSLTISQRMDIAHYCVFATTARLCEQSTFQTSFYRQEFVKAFVYQSVLFQQKTTPLSRGDNGIYFLTPHISPNMKLMIRNNIKPLFSMLNSHIELVSKPNLMNLGHDCLNIIGKMVMKDNEERIQAWEYKYFRRIKRKYGFVTEWSMSDENGDSVRMTEKHQYDLPMTIRNYCTAWGYRTEVIVTGSTWLDIWQACDSVIRNAKTKDGDEDHHIYIENLVKPNDESFDSVVGGYFIREFLNIEFEDDAKIIHHYEKTISNDECEDGEWDDDKFGGNIWYVITGS